jgi:hypothetical protein
MDTKDTKEQTYTTYQNFLSVRRVLGGGWTRSHQ